MPVLMSIPWELVDIRVLIIEVHMIGTIFDYNIHNLKSFMREKGYKLHSDIGFNQIYVKRGFKFEGPDEKPTKTKKNK